jgi:hypothetical protein
MKQEVKPVITTVGKIWGRDAIYLDKVNVINESTFELTGEFNGTLCENLKNEEDKQYQITFKSVRLFIMTELDFNEVEYQSSFDEILNSEQVQKMVKKDSAQHIGKIDDRYKHFVFRTYDTVFEIIGKAFELIIK